jgi:hypothetical protein
LYRAGEEGSRGFGTVRSTIVDQTQRRDLSDPVAMGFGNDEEVGGWRDETALVSMMLRSRVIRLKRKRHVSP